MGHLRPVCFRLSTPFHSRLSASVSEIQFPGISAACIRLLSSRCNPHWHDFIRSPQLRKRIAPRPRPNIEFLAIRSVEFKFVVHDSPPLAIRVSPFVRRVQYLWISSIARRVNRYVKIAEREKKERLMAGFIRVATARSLKNRSVKCYVFPRQSAGKSFGWLICQIRSKKNVRL